MINYIKSIIFPKLLLLFLNKFYWRIICTFFIISMMVETYYIFKFKLSKIIFEFNMLKYAGFENIEIFAHVFTSIFFVSTYSVFLFVLLLKWIFNAYIKI